MQPAEKDTPSFGAVQPVVVPCSRSRFAMERRLVRTEASDHSVAADLSVPKQMGGPGKAGTTTPEHLFAAGYAACFGGALDYVGKQQKKNALGAVVTCAVSIGPRDAGGFGLAVKLNVKDKSLPQAELVALVNEAHEKICPYSHATRGNVEVALEVEGA